MKEREKLTQWIKASPLSLASLAKHAGTQRQNVYRLFDGRMPMDSVHAQSILAVCRKYGYQG